MPSQANPAPHRPAVAGCGADGYTPGMLTGQRLHWPHAAGAPAHQPHALLMQVLPSVLSVLGVAGARDHLQLGGRVHHACVFLVDGLGSSLLEQHAQVAPFLAGMLPAGRNGQLAVGFPSTTATSISSLGTGVGAGEHGLVGYQMAVPGQERVMNTLAWDPDLDPGQWQPVPTVFEQAQHAGLQVVQVVPSKFVGSGFSKAVLRGGRFAVGESVEQRVAAARQAMASGRPGLTYVYYGDLDATGHTYGVDSPQWRYRLGVVDAMAQQLANALPADSGLWVTADHGMIDIAPGGRVDLAATPSLLKQVRLVAGEARARYLYCTPGSQHQVIQDWRDAYGHQAWVLSREDAVRQGLFGSTIRQQVLDRIGDVIVAAAAGVAFVDSRNDRPSTLQLIGMHGSLTDEEMYVPLVQLRT